MKSALAEAVRVRALRADEIEAIKRLAHLWTEPARSVEWAKIVWLAHEGQAVPTIAEALHLDKEFLHQVSRGLPSFLHTFAVSSGHK